MKQRLFLLPLLLAVLFLSACETLPVEQAEPVAVSKTVEVTDRWTWHGRFAVRTAVEGISAGLAWKQEQDQYEILIFDPLGRQLAELVGDDQQVTMRTREGEELTANSAEHLLSDYLGWSIPVSGMRYWVVGQVVPDQPIKAKERDDYGLLSSLQQQGWSIEWQAYQEDAHTYLPEKMLMTRADIRVRLIMDDWWVYRD